MIGENIIPQNYLEIAVTYDSEYDEIRKKHIKEGIKYEYHIKNGMVTRKLKWLKWEFWNYIKSNVYYHTTEITKHLKSKTQSQQTK